MLISRNRSLRKVRLRALGPFLGPFLSSSVHSRNRLCFCATRPLRGGRVVLYGVRISSWREGLRWPGRRRLWRRRGWWQAALPPPSPPPSSPPPPSPPPPSPPPRGRRLRQMTGAVNSLGSLPPEALQSLPYYFSHHDIHGKDVDGSERGESSGVPWLRGWSSLC